MGTLEDDAYRVAWSATTWFSLGLLEFPLLNLPFAYSLPILLTIALLPIPLMSMYTRATLRAVPVARAALWPLSSPRLGDLSTTDKDRSR